MRFAYASPACGSVGTGVCTDTGRSEVCLLCFVVFPDGLVQ